MAENKQTKAQQAASPKKRQKLTVEEEKPKSLLPIKSKAAAKAEVAKPASRIKLPGDAAFPLRYAFAVACGILLLVFISTFFSDQGLLLQWIVAGFTGLFGRNVYYISIPALCYLIWLQLSSRGQRVRGRSFSIIGFVLIFGCLSHLVSDPELKAEGFAKLGVPRSSSLSTAPKTRGSSGATTAKSILFSFAKFAIPSISFAPIFTHTASLAIPPLPGRA